MNELIYFLINGIASLNLPDPFFFIFGFTVLYFLFQMKHKMEFPLPPLDGVVC